MFLYIECRSITDSVDGHSDLSGITVQAANSTRPQMDVVIVLDLCQTDHLQHRKKALEEVKQACSDIGANCNHIQVRNATFYKLLSNKMNPYVMYIGLFIFSLKN